MKAFKIVAILVALAAAYLLLWPTGMSPVAWVPPPAPALEGPYAYNEKLKEIQELAAGFGKGPEAINVDAVGRVYTGYDDGRVMQFSADGTRYTQLADTGGRPLGIAFGPKGGIVVADARKGLLHVGKKTTTLATEADGLPFGFTDDVDSAKFDKHLYFTDASSKFGYGEHMKDLLEHGANGRLLAFDAGSGQTRVLLSGLHFANGVAVGPNDDYVLVNETGAYRVLRYWLKGEKRGTHEVFIDNLPGFPDNITFNGRDTFWLALFAPRDALLDELLPGRLFLRTVLAKLPAFLQPRAKRHAFVLGLGLDGTVAHNLQYAGDDAYAPITSVREHGPWLYFGSLTHPAIGRLPLNSVVADAPAPPEGWQQLPGLQPDPEPTGRKAASKRKQEREALKAREQEDDEVPSR